MTGRRPSRRGDLLVFMRLLRLARPVAPWFALAGALSLATLASGVGLMAASAYIIAAAALHPSIAALQVAIVGVRFFGISRGIFRYFERYSGHDATFRLLARLRVWFYRRLEPLAPARLWQFRSGDLLSRIVADIETLEHFYVRVLSPPLVAAAAGLGLGFLLARWDLRLAFVLGLGLLSSGLLLPALTRSLGRAPGERAVQASSALHAALVESVQGMADLLAYGRQAQQHDRLDGLNREAGFWQRRMARVSGMSLALSHLVTSFTVAGVLIVAVPLVTQGHLPGVLLTVIVLAVMAGFEAVAPLPEAFQHLPESLAAARRLFEVVDAEPAVHDPANPSSPPGKLNLSVRGLSFRYGPGEPWALSNLNFDLQPGGRIAVVGPSGAGKTTLARLLLRFWDYEVGTILLGGVDLRSLRQQDVRGLIDILAQDPYLFNTSLRENLRLANPEAPAEVMRDALRRVGLDVLLERRPSGLDTWIGEQGLRLSGGEAQRLAIARLLIRDTPLLILDEPLRNLDAITEREVLAALQEAMQGRSALFITHRLLGMETFDQILVLDGGEIVARGRHEELLRREGLYRRMWHAQRDSLP